MPRPVEIVVQDDTVASWLEAEWPFGRSGPPVPTEGSVLRITIRTDDARPLKELPTADALPGASGTMHLRIDGQEFWVWEAPHAHTAPSEACAVRAFVDGPDVTIIAYGSPFNSWAALTNAFHEAVALSGLVPFHAAAVHRPASPGQPEQTWMILGPSGRGKTTTLLRAVRAGWLAVAEDVCWLSPGTLEVVGSDTTVGVRSPSLGVLHDVLPATSELAPGAHADAKVLVPWDKLGAIRDPVTVTHVVELRHGPEAEVGFADSTALRTVMALYEAGGIPRTDQARTALAFAIGRLTEGTRSATLRLGRIDLPFP